MTGAEKLLLFAGLGVAVVAIVYWRKSAPASGGYPLGLPDPSTVPLGTTMNVGGTNYIVTQTRLPGSRPQWTFGGYGGGVPGMFT